MVTETPWPRPGYHVPYSISGWLAFFLWSISFYPQVVLNYQRKSVVGLNFDFLVLNFTKHSSYLLYNCLIFFSSDAQHELKSYYDTNTIPVALNDVVFSIHAVALTSFTVLQTTIYQRANQRVSLWCTMLSSVLWALVILTMIMCAAGWTKWTSLFSRTSAGYPTWIWMLDVLNFVQLLCTLVKYTPQAYFNFKRKSTVGWSIGNILCDLSGGGLNFLQQTFQAFGTADPHVFTSNVGKVGLSLISVAFDIFFVIQHYVLYRHTVTPNAHMSIQADEISDPLLDLPRDGESRDIEEGARRRSLK